jgi:cell division protein FtsZ
MDRRRFLQAISSLIAITQATWGRADNAHLTPTDDAPKLDSISDDTLSPEVDALDWEPDPISIKVIGIGGAGGNAVTHIIRAGMRGADFIYINSDASALSQVSGANVLQLGNGMPTGGDVDLGRELANADRGRISELLGGAHLVILAAGLGGGTGTGVLPVIARIAQDMGIMSIPVVTRPFDYEGHRAGIADTALVELAATGVTPIVIANEAMIQDVGDDATMAQFFAYSNEVIGAAIASIVETIAIPGLVNPDLQDVRSIMAESGSAVTSTAAERGPHRAALAARQSLARAKRQGIDLGTAPGIIVGISAGPSLGMQEVRDVLKAVRSVASGGATIIFGAITDQSDSASLRVTLIATRSSGMLVSRWQEDRA